MYPLYQTVSFGGSKANLPSVGYALYSSNGTMVSSRTTVGINDLGSGQYGAMVSFPTGFTGRITWDTGEALPIYTSAPINTSDFEDEELEIQQLDSIHTEIGQLRKDLTTGDVHPSELPEAGVSGSLTLVRAHIPTLDHCPILTRFKAFVVDQGVRAILEHTFRDKKGNVIDLSDWLEDPVDSSSSASSLSAAASIPAGTVKVRIKEWLGAGYRTDVNPVWEVWGEPVSPNHGTVHATLPGIAVEHAGIYELNWAVVDDRGRAVLIDRGILSVERSLFAASLETLYSNYGPPTLQEIRMLLMDSSSNENLLLDDVEFNDEQILLALTKPVQQWNETPPPIERFTTRNFPFRGAWAQGVLGTLHLLAANHYRRNRLQHTAGGVSLDDLNKEREYMAEGQRLQTEYTTWLQTKKVELNIKKFCGQSVSAYSGRTGW